MSALLDFFGELPIAVFEVVSGISAEAARRASPTARRPLVRRESIFTSETIRLVRTQFDWVEVECERAAAEDAVDVIARLRCGHWARYRINALYKARCRGVNEEFDLLARVVDGDIEGAERSCCCMTCEEA